MRLAATVAYLALLLHTISASPFQQQPAAKGSIEGSVTRAGTGDPIPGARVTLTRMGGVLPVGASTLPAEASRFNSTGSATSVLTDSQGRFAIRDLDAGAYRVSAGA